LDKFAFEDVMLVRSETTSYQEHFTQKYKIYFPALLRPAFKFFFYVFITKDAKPNQLWELLSASAIRG